MKTPIFHVESRVLYINGKRIPTESFVNHYVIYDDRVVIRLEWDYGVDDRNIYCYGADGVMLWQIQEIEIFGDDKDYYGSLFLNDSDMLTSVTFCGRVYAINILDGTTEYTGYLK